MRCPVLALLALAFAPLAATAQLPAFEVELLADTNTAPSALRSSYPVVFGVLGPHAYFTAETPHRGRELYRTDGTAGGLESLGGFAPNFSTVGTGAQQLVGGRLVVALGDSEAEYWSLSPGTAPIRLTPRTPTGFPWVPPAFAGSRLVFSPGGSDGVVWSTDGTAAGTQVVAGSGSFPHWPRQICSVGATTVVAGLDTNLAIQLGATDGLTGSGLAQVVADVSTSVIWYSAALDGSCYFLFPRSTGGWALWRSDGSVAGTQEITRTSAGAPRAIAAYAGKIFLLASTGSGASPVQLLGYTPSQAAPVVVSTLSAQQPAYLRFFPSPGGLLFTSARSTPSSWDSLYISDGTTVGTRLLFPTTQPFELNATPLVLQDHVYVYGLRIALATGAATAYNGPGDAVLGSRLVGTFSGPQGHELWSSDGTTAGSALLNDIWPSTEDGAVDYAVPVSEGRVVADAGTIFFTLASEGGRPGENLLMRSDGTPAGTDILPRSAHGQGSADQVALFDGDVMLSSRGNGGEIYRVEADLSAATYLRSVPIAPTLQGTGDGRGLIFGCHSQSAGGELCGLRDDGAQAVISPAATNLSPFRRIGEVGDAAVFTTTDAIWRSDGTAPGTFVLLQGRRAGAPTYAPIMAERAGGRLYFVSCGSGECRLTATDGTLAGTTLLKDVSGGNVAGIARLREQVVFGLRGFGQTQLQLWITDGSEAGTTLLRSTSAYGESSLVSVGNYVHAISNCETFCGAMYVVTDGTPEGTRVRTLPAPIASTFPGLRAALGTQGVVFACFDEVEENELCLADASGENFVRATAIAVEHTENFELIGSTASAVHFLVDDGLHGREPWVIRLRDALFADDFALD